MLYLVAYDIAAPKRLRRVACACKDFGVRVEKSVFECDLPPKVFQAFWRRLGALIEPETDMIVAYRICAACASEVMSLGAVPRPEKPAAYIL